MTRPKTRVLCVDDHAFLVDGLEARFELEPDIEFVGRLPSAEGVVGRVKETGADVVLLDIEMPGPDPFDAAEDLKRQCPAAKVIVLSAHVRDHYIKSAFDAGCYGYFSKSDDPDELIRGIRRAVDGDFALGPKVQDRCKSAAGGPATNTARPRTRLDALTAREQEVLRLIGRGLSRHEIAKTLCRSPKTVDGHREAIMAKLDIRDRAALVRFAIREGLVEP